jgi:hypothetical protein
LLDIEHAFANPVEELEAVKKFLLNVSENPGSPTDMLKKKYFSMNSSSIPRHCSKRNLRDSD